jgi:hypothetical protein
MSWLALALAAVLALAGPVDAQDRPVAGLNREQGAPGSAGPKDDGVVQRGAPSTSAGTVVPRDERRILGLPVTAALLIGAVLVVLVVVAGVIVPAARRRERAQGGGTCGRP